MKDLMKMMAKKKDKGEMSKEDKQAKMDVLKELLEMAMEKSGMDVSEGMKQLTIAAPDKEGLMEGMEKAEEMMDEMPNGEEDEIVEDEMPEDEMPEEDEEEEDKKERY